MSRLLDRERLYALLPDSLQRAAVQVEGWRLERSKFGGDFEARLAAYLAHDRLSADELHAVRREKMRAVLGRAAREVPYWSEAFRKAGLDPGRVEGPDDLAALPVLTKDEILRQGDRLRNPNVPRSRLVSAHTSGTTGAGLVFVWTVEARRDQWAVWWRHRMRHGIARGTWFAAFQGRTIVPGVPRRSVYWRTNRPGRQVMYSQYHFNPATAPLYLEDLARRQLPWYHGYPSFLAMVAAAALASPAKPELRPRFVTTGAENLLATQKRVIEEAFGVAPVQHYGLAEAVANASQCPNGLLHLDEDFAAVELRPASGGAYRILGTGLANDAMPFVRYDTGDLARLAPEGCPCGLPGRVLSSIDGREEDVLELSDGSLVGRLDHLFKDMVRVAEAQIRQKRPGACRIVLVPRPGFTSRDEQALLRECRDRFGDRLDVEIEIAESIERTPSGKLRMVIREN